MCQALDWGVAMSKARMVPVVWSQEIPPLKERTLCIQREPEWRGEERAKMQLYDTCVFCCVCLLRQQKQMGK